jgi:hypothetical protein
MIYTSARFANAGHTQVTGTDEFGNTETRSIDNPHEYRREDEFITGFLDDGGVIAAYVAPDPATVVPHLNNSGLIRVSGALPVTILEAIRMIGAQRVAKGRYRALHETPMPSDQYSVTVSILDIRPLVARVTARTASYTEVRVTDLAGVAQDPTEVTIETTRVVY